MEDYLADENTGIELLYRGQQLHNTPFSDITDYNKFCEELELLPLSDDTYFSKDFNIPQHYREIDIREYVSKLGQRGPDETGRVEMELDMFEERGLFPILQLLIYIIDKMRKHNLVWGVGRGSSVSSYLLYILGVHKVNSYKYNLDIKEFLK
jgi:DNA polymerase III alpha subunit|tara:strand:- start:1168 stop:1623 length:456 start_codon:yes stop_codon:yes gene_type:complete